MDRHSDRPNTRQLQQKCLTYYTARAPWPPMHSKEMLEGE